MAENNTSNKNSNTQISKKLTEDDLISQFIKFDLNKDNQIDEYELYLMIEEIYKNSFSKYKLLDLDRKIITKTVKDILKVKDEDKNGMIDLEEFISYYKNKDILEIAQDSLLDNTRSIVYLNRIAMLMRRLPIIKSDILGDHIKPLLSPSITKYLYFLTFGYILIDTSHKTYSVKVHGKEKMAYQFIDTSIWHSLASMAFPGITIHSIVTFSEFALNKLTSKSKSKSKYNSKIVTIE